jgi:hypothetical protein
VGAKLWAQSKIVGAKLWAQTKLWAPVHSSISGARDLRSAKDFWVDQSVFRDSERLAFASLSRIHALIVGGACGGLQLRFPPLAPLTLLVRQGQARMPGGVILLTKVARTPALRTPML